MEKMIYLISDTYFGRFTSAKNRSIDPEKYNQQLIDNWNSIVKPDDVVWHLGGFGWDVLSLEAVLIKLNGVINVIMAPTDECQKDVFHIHGIPTHKGYFELTGHNVVLSHYPMVNWPGKDTGTMLIHGCNKEYKAELHKELRFNVNCDLWSLGPVSLKSLKEVNELIYEKTE